MKTDLERCATYRRLGNFCTISCRKGLWEVSGKYSIDLINEAENYFNQYKSDGEYSDILGGKYIFETLMDKNY